MGRQSVCTPGDPARVRCWRTRFAARQAAYARKSAEGKVGGRQARLVRHSIRKEEKPDRLEPQSRNDEGPNGAPPSGWGKCEKVSRRQAHMGILQQKNQLELDFGEGAGNRPAPSSEMPITSCPESPTGDGQLMETVCERQNMLRALHRVISNKGAPGIDGMTVEQLTGYVIKHWHKIKADLLAGQYHPLPVRRKEIPKPDGGIRPLGIPCVLDRLIQQAMAQVLEPMWDCTFSESSFGYRPGHSAHDAIRQCKRFVEEGHRHIVKIDIEKFFDRVNHDRLMSRLATRVHDRRFLRQIRRFLTSGVMIGGLVSPTGEGTPQGGPLSPLLSNIVLDELDKELEKRGLHFVRYADDCVIYVKSRRAGDRVMQSVSLFIIRRLKLRVNKAKSSVTHPWWSKYLGFSFTGTVGDTRIRIHSKTMQRLKVRIREITARERGRSVEQIIRELNSYLRGWWGYFALSETRSCLPSVNGWIIRRLRAYIWKQWKLPRTKVRELIRRGVPKYRAVQVGNTRKGAWRLSKNGFVKMALPNRYFTASLGLFLPGPSPA